MLLVWQHDCIQKYTFCREEVSIWGGGSGIVCTIGSLLSRYATKAMLATAAKAALKGSLKAAKRAVPHLIAHKVVCTIVDAAKKRKRVDINVKSSQEPQSKKALVDTGPDINALIDGFGIVLD